jgi:hypothetical protein
LGSKVFTPGESSFSFFTALSIEVRWSPPSIFSTMQVSASP